MDSKFGYAAISWADRASGLVAAVSILLAIPACATVSPKSAADHVVETNQCGDVAGDSNLDAVLSGRAVAEVRRLYANVSGPAQDVQLRGATVVVRALPGMTAEWLARQLKCHSAQETLAQNGDEHPDPFFLPDTPVAIAVRPMGSVFAVDISVFPPKAAMRILDRASDWLSSRAGAVSLY